MCLSQFGTDKSIRQIEAAASSSTLDEAHERKRLGEATTLYLQRRLQVVHLEHLHFELLIKPANPGPDALAQLTKRCLHLKLGLVPLPLLGGVHVNLDCSSKRSRWSHTGNGGEDASPRDGTMRDCERADELCYASRARTRVCDRARLSPISGRREAQSKGSA